MEIVFLLLLSRCWLLHRSSLTCGYVVIEVRPLFTVELSWYNELLFNVQKLLLLSKRGCLWISLNLISSSNNFCIVQFTTIKMLSDAKKATYNRCITNASTVRRLCFSLWQKGCYLAENSWCESGEVHTATGSFAHKVSFHNALAPSVPALISLHNHNWNTGPCPLSWPECSPSPLEGWESGASAEERIPKGRRRES